ncbi:MAG: ribosomal protein S18-alanine N-acetyltransferase [Vampirovibrionales bacterium]|nr:ribosomal protein S18-alanine N-acetyltransferase [Vampirovibrionales bacterium]
MEQAETTATQNAPERLPPKKTVDVSALRIRRMRPEDVDDVMEIESVSFGRHHWVADSFLAEMNNAIGRYFSLLMPLSPINDETSDASKPEKLIGYGGFWHVIDEAHITTVAVAPEYRGNALGEVMFLQMIEHCYKLSIHWATLEVRSGNHAAQNLYYKYGLQCVGVRPKYYQDNQEDALIMTSGDLTDREQQALYNQNKAALLNRLGAFPRQFGE